MFCCNRQQSSNSQLPIQISKISDKSEFIDDYFEHCEQHDKQIAFICKSWECRDRNNSMACNECIVSHKDHDWITKEDFLTPNICNILSFKKAETDQILESTSKKLQNHFNQIQSNIVDQFQRVRFQFQRSMINIQEKYRFKIDKTKGSSHVILNKIKLQKLLSIYEIEQSKFQWIKVMQQNIFNITNQINQSFKNLLQDLMNITDAEKWQLRQSHIDEFKQFEKHLHWHINGDDRYHKFSAYDKHMNLRLNNHNDEITYVRSVPSKPVAVGSENISHVHNKFGFQIMKMKSKAIFFDSTVVFVGVCSVNTVKSYGFRKVNQYGKGTYLISSQGWAYHSTDQNFNDKEIVGWGFGQGDKIQIQINFDADCIIKFTKKGRFFQNKFEMPLDLNEFQMNRLKPCVGFDSEQGTIVKIFDIKAEPLQIDL